MKSKFFLFITLSSFFYMTDTCASESSSYQPTGDVVVTDAREFYAALLAGSDLISEDEQEEDYDAEYKFTSEETDSISEKAIGDTLKNRRIRNAEAAARSRAKQIATEAILAVHFKLSPQALRNKTPKKLINEIEKDYTLIDNEKEKRKISSAKAQKKLRVKRSNSLDILQKKFIKLPQEQQNALNEKILQRQDELFQEYLERKTGNQGQE